MRFISLPTLPALVGKAEGMVEGMVEGSTDGEEEGAVEGKEEGSTDGMEEGMVVAAAGHTSTEGPSNAVYNVAKRK